MILFLEMGLIKDQLWQFSVDSIAVWTNLPNVYSDRCDPLENSSLNFFVIFPRLGSIRSLFWIELSVDSLIFVRLG